MSRARPIDTATWPRAGQFAHFRAYAQPHFSITAPLDVSRLVRRLKPEGVSVFNACVYAITEGGNAVPELRTRFSGDRVYEHEAVGASFTVPLQAGGFAFCEVGRNRDFERFDRTCSQAIEAARQQQGLTDTTADQDAWLFLSCLPWLSFSAMTHALRGPEDCVPRIAWGRYHEDAAGRLVVPVSIQVHHALVDGEHVGAFFAAAQVALDGLKPGTLV
ncbi:chloramphenicol acetyltransferase [Zhengella mangrovi]|uniref:Chloramphenicol acetyltransferase n=1 Tax=Zhengella mangrovi TaxID=1982044 RepID=A0A2G1QTB7_9HYPH|nr:chloramphenicol acetyltransferase [Zhengella mangrovi]PHP68468.1 chloramphenicol acetyltransferase [Zhengella mangrovi]